MKTVQVCSPGPRHTVTVITVAIPPRPDSDGNRGPARPPPISLSGCPTQRDDMHTQERIHLAEVPRRGSLALRRPGGGVSRSLPRPGVACSCIARHLPCIISSRHGGGHLRLPQPRSLEMAGLGGTSTWLGCSPRLGMCVHARMPPRRQSMASGRHIGLEAVWGRLAAEGEKRPAVARPAEEPQLRDVGSGAGGDRQVR